MLKYGVDMVFFLYFCSQFEIISLSAKLQIKFDI
jgi:hypothetical protein